MNGHATELVELLDLLERQLSAERHTLHQIIDLLLLSGDTSGALDAIVDDEQNVSARRAKLHRTLNEMRRAVAA